MGDIVAVGGYGYLARDWDRMPHGTIGGYSNYTCRCESCRRAWRDYQREYERRPDVKRRRSEQMSNLRRLARIAKDLGL